MREYIINAIREEKFIAIMRGMEAKLAVKTAEALCAGGIHLMEVAMSQYDNGKEACLAINYIKQQLGDKIEIGAGTVLTAEQVKQAKQAGAQYIISPNVNKAVIAKTRELGLVSIPGAFTASESMMAHEAGADFIKIFPASSVGPSYIKALRAPLCNLEFIAVGGINECNLGDYLKAGAVAVAASGNLVNKQWIENGFFDQLTMCAQKYINAVIR